MLINHKFNTGDKVKFKDKFINPSCGLVGREGTVVTIKGAALPYNNKPHYYLEEIPDSAFAESCFAGKAVENV